MYINPEQQAGNAAIHPDAFLMKGPFGCIRRIAKPSMNINPEQQAGSSTSDDANATTEPDTRAYMLPNGKIIKV